jgi:hypothetical protein
VDDVVHGAAVGVAKLVSDLLVRAPLGGQLDGAGLSGGGQGTVAVPTADEGKGCGDAHENHYQTRVCQSP